MNDNDTAAPSLRDLVTAYLESQDLDHLAPLRRAVAGSATFDPDLELLSKLDPLMEEGRHREIVDAVTAKMPGAALNPTAHLAMSAALEALGDEPGAKRESIMAKVAVSSVLATGDGSEESPWSVLRVADEYDIMRAKGIASTGQSAQSRDGRMVDRHETADGGAVWFVIDEPARPAPDAE